MMATQTKTPQQLLFDDIFKRSMHLGYDTYDYLPAASASYPFVFVGEQFNTDLRTKRFLYGSINQTVHVYAVQRNGQQSHGMGRAEFTTMLESIKTEMRSIRRLERFRVRVDSVTDQVMIDTSSPTTLYHGVIEAEYTFN